MEDQACKHLKSFKLIKPDKYFCEECVKTGSSWLHLRCCQTCGAVLCCDSSPNQHASKHAAHTHHPVVISAEPGEYWAYCYPDDIMIDINPF
ncbi:UBP-type zinc finger domain-containing protein [Mucilaginibacter phyllosphaerae]